MKLYIRILILSVGAFFMTTVGVFANEEPVVKVLSAAMRPDTTLMDVSYRVDDADNATVKVRALAFVDGVRSFANVLRPMTFIEGTEGNLGDTITTGVEHTLTWDVGADWDVDLAQIKFEILARDDRGLLSFDWITIPAAGGEPLVTISKNIHSNTEVLDAFFWEFSDFSSELSLTNGVVQGSVGSGNFQGVELVSGSTVLTQGWPYIFKKMNIDPSTHSEVSYVSEATRQSFDMEQWYATSRLYNDISIVQSWGYPLEPIELQKGTTADISAISAGSYHVLGLRDDGTVIGWGRNGEGQTTTPDGLTNVISISAGYKTSYAVKEDGTVEAWGYNGYNAATPPAGLSNVVAVSAGYMYALVLKNDGTIEGWGYNHNECATPPAGLTNVVAISAGLGNNSLALKNDGTVVAWGTQYVSVPAGLSNVTAISAGKNYNLALKNDGTVVGWGSAEKTPPAGLNNVIAVSAGGSGVCMALKNDGTVVAWGYNYGSVAAPAGMVNVTAIEAGDSYCVSLK